MKSLAKSICALGIAVFVVGSFFLLHPLTSEAQTISSVQEEEAELRARLAELEKEIKEQELLLSSQRGTSQGIQSRVNSLRAEINTTKESIDVKERLIRQLSGQITDKQETIQDLSTELEREKTSLAKLVRKSREIDDQSIVEIILSGKSISSFFRDLDIFIRLQNALYDSSNVIKQVRAETDEQRETLEKKKAEEADIKYELEQDKQKVEQKEQQQNNLLSVSKQKEQSFEQMIASRKAQAAEIRARLFELAGDIPEGGIPFGDALQYAREASTKTGVRPALILAILQQESAMGKNVGTCNRPGDSRTWRDIMPGPGESWRDDQAAFLQIMNELGLPPEGQPLSCPLSSGGWGGAMGPTQFIPTTWLSVREALKSMLNIDATNPWNPRHAVHATGIYMRDLGAAVGGFTAEREAACKYYSGRGCFAPNVSNMFYGNQVMAKADTIQRDIDFLEEQARD